MEKVTPLLSELLCDEVSAEPSGSILKRTYISPQLVSLGSVKELTLAVVFGTVSDSGGMMMASAASSADVKESIHYLSHEEKKQVSATMFDVKVATYNYIGDTTPRTGMIIEDAPSAPFVSQDKKTVDLYAYASSILVAVQHLRETVETQAKTIESLQTQLRDLTSRS